MKGVRWIGQSFGHGGLGKAKKKKKQHLGVSKRSETEGVYPE